MSDFMRYYSQTRMVIRQPSMMTPRPAPKAPEKPTVAFRFSRSKHGPRIVPVKKRGLRRVVRRYRIAVDEYRAKLAYGGHWA